MCRATAACGYEAIPPMLDEARSVDSIAQKLRESSLAA